LALLSLLPDTIGDEPVMRWFWAKTFELGRPNNNEIRKQASASSAHDI